MPYPALIEDALFWVPLGRLEWPELQAFVATMIRRALVAGGVAELAWARDLQTAADTVDPVEAGARAKALQPQTKFAELDLRESLLPLQLQAVGTWGPCVVAIFTVAPKRQPLWRALCLRQLATACADVAAAASKTGRGSSAQAVERSKIRIEGRELLR